MWGDFLKTLVFITPVSGGHKTRDYEDFDAGCGTVRVIYCNEGMGAVRRMYYKHTLSKLIKDNAAVCTEKESAFGGKTFYKDGLGLALFYIKQICLTVLDGEHKEIIICSKSMGDCGTLREVIESFDVKILTLHGLVREYCEYLSEEFGIADGACAAAPLDGKCVIVMPDCEDFSVKGASDVINLSGAKLSFPCITPDSLRFSPPEILKEAAYVLRRGDSLQTALDFFGLSYENLNLLSLKTGI